MVLGMQSTLSRAKVPAQQIKAFREIFDFFTLRKQGRGGGGVGLPLVCLFFPFFPISLASTLQGLILFE